MYGEERAMSAPVVCSQHNFGKSVKHLPFRGCREEREGSFRHTQMHFEEGDGSLVAETRETYWSQIEMLPRFLCPDVDYSGAQKVTSSRIETVTAEAGFETLESTKIVNVAPSG